MSEEELKKEELKEHFEFLNDLRESGVTNMFGATPYLVQEFGVNTKEAREILSAWMHSFDK